MCKDLGLILITEKRTGGRERGEGVRGEIPQSFILKSRKTIDLVGTSKWRRPGKNHKGKWAGQCTNLIWEVSWGQLGSGGEGPGDP